MRYDVRAGVGYWFVIDRVTFATAHFESLTGDVERLANEYADFKNAQRPEREVLMSELSDVSKMATNAGGIY